MVRAHPMTILVSLLLFALGSEDASPAPSAPGRVLYVQPLGSCSSKARGVEEVVAALRAFYTIDVRVLACQELPKAAYYPPRKRYRAERLLTTLNQRMPKGGWRILGLTDVDISTTKDQFPDWGVMGLGELPGTATVISAFRCRKKARNQAHAIQRLAKVAVHEIGHTLGLPHCPTRGCLMEDAMGKVTTTDRERDFCPLCRRLAKRNGFTIVENPAASWLRGR
jgi:archaemetzincin